MMPMNFLTPFAERVNVRQEDYLFFMAKVNYNNRCFVSIENTPNGEVSGETIFNYQHTGDIVWATYQGGSIVKGHLIAKVDDKGVLDMRYHHINTQGSLMTGQCQSIPEILDDGRLRLHEVWQWTSGDLSSGTSIVEEIKAN